jgi:hypothetical protein
MRGPRIERREAEWKGVDKKFIQRNECACQEYRLLAISLIIWILIFENGHSTERSPNIAANLKVSSPKIACLMSEGHNDLEYQHVSKPESGGATLDIPWKFPHPNQGQNDIDTCTDVKCKSACPYAVHIRSSTPNVKVSHARSPPRPACSRHSHKSCSSTIG